MARSFAFIFCFFIFLNNGNCQLLKPIKGLSFVAPPKPFDRDPFIEVKAVEADWIAVIPYAFSRPGDPSVRYDHADTSSKWWGESPKGVMATIQGAQKNNLKIMLKPQVWHGREWIGNLQFSKEADWKAWEASYEAYILPFADLAEKECVEILCIGTEIKQSVIQRPHYWNQLIRKIRQRYHGLITYAANWDEYTAIKFWPALDFIGIDAYFPLSDLSTPKVTDLMHPWEQVLKELEKTHKKYKKKILFTEYGYLSVDGAAGKTWELESKLPLLSYNEDAQANSIQALIECCKQKSFWAGGFLWKWYPDIHLAKKGMAKDHTPQGKLAEKVLRNLYLDL
jgi:hypothetical protein